MPPRDPKLTKGALKAARLEIHRAQAQISPLEQNYAILDEVLEILEDLIAEYNNYEKN